jgi:enoyl-CoA hydratase/carnithine racemase
VEFQRLRLERDGDVLHVHLNRPECRNALDASALEEIERLFGSLQRDFGVRVVVLGGSGPSFCGGADRRDPPGARRLAADSGATDARLHGHVVGGGVALAAACDFRIASRDTSFHVPEVDLGIPLAWGATPRLIAEIGAARARELILLCERVGAEQAERWGLVHRVVEAEQLDSVVSDWARRLSAKPEVAVHMTKTQLRAYAARASLGNVAEADGDLLLGASRLGRARQSFPRPPQGSGPDGA